MLWLIANISSLNAIIILSFSLSSMRSINWAKAALSMKRILFWDKSNFDKFNPLKYSLLISLSLFWVKLSSVNLNNP